MTAVEQGVPSAISGAGAGRVTVRHTTGADVGWLTARRVEDALTAARSLTPAIPQARGIAVRHQLELVRSLP